VKIIGVTGLYIHADIEWFLRVDIALAFDAVDIPVLVLIQ
jgi:hypothetical protein